MSEKGGGAPRALAHHPLLIYLLTTDHSSPYYDYGCVIFYSLTRCGRTCQVKRALAHLFNRLLSICYRGWVSLIELSRIEREQKQKRAVAMMTMRGCVRSPSL